MRFTAEASFDLDEKRKVWIRADADEVAAEDAPLVAASLAEAVTNQAAQAYAHAVATIPEITGGKPVSMQTFQE